MTSRSWRWAVVTAVVLMSPACTRHVGGRESAPAPSVAATSGNSAQVDTIDHLTPRRDSSGGVPGRFEWTAVKGAESYTIGLWNEVDRMLWRQSGLQQPFVATPKELELDPGTYFWSVVAVRGDRLVAESGLAAFVVAR